MSAAIDIELPGMAEDVPTITVECPECGETFTGKASGRGSVNFNLGRHRKQAHNVAGSKRSRAKKSVVTDVDFASHPVASTVREITGAIGQKKGTPSADDLAAGLGRGLTLTTLTAAVYAAESDPSIAADDQASKDFLISYLSLSERAAMDMMAPLARAFAPTKFNKRFGRQVVDNVDVVASIAELATLTKHWTEYLRLRRAGAQQLRQPAPLAAVIPIQPEAPTAPVPTSGTGAANAGRVVTAEDVQAMRGRNG